MELPGDPPPLGLDRQPLGAATLDGQAADRLGYRWARLDGPAPGERGLHRTIGLVIADVTNPFYGDIIKGAYEAAREAGLLLILSGSWLSTDGRLPPGLRRERSHTRGAAAVEYP